MLPYSIWNAACRVEVGSRAAIRVASFESKGPNPSVAPPPADAHEVVADVGHEERDGFVIHSLDGEVRRMTGFAVLFSILKFSSLKGLSRSRLSYYGSVRAVCVGLAGSSCRILRPVPAGSPQPMRVCSVVHVLGVPPDGYALCLAVWWAAAQDAAKPVILDPEALARGIAAACQEHVAGLRSAVTVSADAVNAQLASCDKFVTGISQASQRDSGLSERVAAADVLARVVQVCGELCAPSSWTIVIVVVGVSSLSTNSWRARCRRCCHLAHEPARLQRRNSSRGSSSLWRFCPTRTRVSMP